MKTIFLLLFFSVISATQAGEVFDAVRFLHPSAKLFDDYEIRDEVIVRWNATKLGPQPTQAQIDQAKIDLQAARDAAATQLSQERVALQSARTKLLNNETLTQNELNAVLRLLIRRSLLRD
jgi:hypothetical protein